jgi:hypothetical protein
VENFQGVPSKPAEGSNKVLAQAFLFPPSQCFQSSFFSRSNNNTFFFKIAIEDHVLEKMFKKWERKDFRSAGKKATVV